MPGSTFPSPLMIPPESTSVLGHADSISFYEKEKGMQGEKRQRDWGEESKN